MLLRRIVFWLFAFAQALATYILVIHAANVDPGALPPVASSAGRVLPEPAGSVDPQAPRYGQPGKDVVWIPSEQAVVDAMLDLAQVTPDDTLIDLGSGDGRIVIGAARRGAHAIGIEYDPLLVDVSRQNAVNAGVDHRASFVRGDIFEADLSPATVITMFLLPELNLRLRPTLLKLRPGTRVVSNTFTMDDWMPDRTAPVNDNCPAWCVAMLWVVPADVRGMWRLAGGTLAVTQHFQELDVVLSAPAGRRVVGRGRLNGTAIQMTIGSATYEGQVTGDLMSGTLEEAGRSAPWSAMRMR